MINAQTKTAQPNHTMSKEHNESFIKAAISYLRAYRVRDGFVVVEVNDEARKQLAACRRPELKGSGCVYANKQQWWFADDDALEDLGKRLTGDRRATCGSWRDTNPGISWREDNHGVSFSLVAHYEPEAKQLSSAQEREVLDRLAEAWRAFLMLGCEHQAVSEFSQAIHVAAGIVARRTLSRHEPDFWNAP